MRVKNRKCIRRLSFKSLWASRKRNIIAICAIALTTLMFTSLFTIMLSVNSSYETYNFRQAGGYSDGSFKDLSREQADKIAALGIGPMGNVAARSQLLIECGLHRIKAGHQTATMLCHVGQHALLVLQEADMAQLVHLIVADDHDREALADVLHHSFAAGQGGNTCARERDLAGGSKHENTILMAVLLTLIEQDRCLDDLIGQVVDDISLVPENFKVRSGGLHSGKTLNGLIAVDIAIGIGVLGHTPDTLDGIILCHQFFDHIHIRTRGAHGDVNHLKAELLGDGKVAVIARHRAEELALGHL